MGGKVYLVGCGPGAPDLLTKRAIDILKKADTVLYDRLIEDKVLEYTKQAEKINVGKRPGETVKQAKINRLLYSKVREGKVVARLKNGNPVIFARGGEELKFLRERGVDVEIVPGLSSATSLPPLAGIPLTQRGISSSLSILTGVGARGKEPGWDKVGDTAVLLMVVKNLSKIVEKLYAAGKDRETQCALISSGSTCEERLIVAPLYKIAEMAEVIGIKPPSILVVGEVVNQLLDIKGRTLAFFRLGEDVERTESLVKRAGGIPKIYEIGQVVTSGNFELKEALREDWDRLVFMSSHGVRSAAEIVDLARYKAIAIGNRTKSLLEKFGCQKIEVPTIQNSKGIQKLLKKTDGKNLALRSSLAEERLKGAENVVAYSIKPTNLSIVCEEYLAEKPDFTILTSSGFLKLLIKSAQHSGKESRFKEALDQSFVISVGRKTTEQAQSLGIHINYEMVTPNIKSFLLGFARERNRSPRCGEKI